MVAAGRRGRRHRRPGCRCGRPLGPPFWAPPKLASTGYRRATEAGHTGAQFNLGVLLADRGELGEAESWLRRAAEAGDTGAQTNLGVLLLENWGEVGEAESWWRRAAEAGDADAQTNLGVLRANGVRLAMVNPGGTTDF